MTEEAQNIIKTIKQMEASLEDNKHNSGYDLDSQVFESHTLSPIAFEI